MIAAALGWLGTIGTLVAYLMLTRGHLAASSLSYAMLNALGGLFGGAASAAYGAWPSATSNFVWAALGLHSAIAAVCRHRRRELDSQHSEIQVRERSLHAHDACALA